MHRSAGMGTEVISLGEDTFAFCVGKFLRFAVGYFFFVFCYCYHDCYCYCYIVFVTTVIIMVVI